MKKMDNNLQNSKSNQHFNIVNFKILRTRNPAKKQSLIFFRIKITSQNVN